jgi:alkanesulfonate monooxygenase SsuD/methylene tetrahydromethanopterin reductase-like flavin-dependent oxidoreductase (luciferase family)
MPTRNVLPKPSQDPHPPLWVACTDREMIRVAAQAGIGALCFAFEDPDTAEEWVDIYYETFKNSCVPIGRDVNPNIAMVTGFSCHEDGDVARERGEEGFAFFQYALTHYYVFGEHEPGRTNIWKEFQEAGGVDAIPDDGGEAAIGTPEHIREHLYGFEEAGVDQVIFVQQGGNNEHEHICDSLELFAEEVMPEFHERHAERQREKREELKPYIEKAIERKEQMEPMDDEEIPTIYPYDRGIEASDD